MIRIERGNEVKPGVFEWRVPDLRLEGRSRHPLSDACRAIKRMDDRLSLEEAGIWREGSDQPSLTCQVGKGAMVTVEDGQHQIRFVRFREFDAQWLAEAAE